MVVKMGPKNRTVKAKNMAITLTKEMMTKTVSQIPETVHTRRTAMDPLLNKKVNLESPIMSASLKSWPLQSKYNPRKF